ncbi:kua-ubiquitin conjugating enzyme hybrid localization domain protein [Leptospira licerasiae serovar Varillal str. VAR 010]|uniref:Kua-ubiquitin conjugating enzyme hybrid localization domain protein n=2 Tax=Leptospira licerasiae TaxID=447106 RepID=A0ABP2RCD6_9LEPT|nr:fatty acid desaturase CarF family protein [Leptospira licerasiae]EIE02933.1 kua-ubiquitin conjugating enzyme hybrid localization domain protein [Leptospira licerasiae serovar Varillal str. VAR 010]EJZ40937.1 kua-ubiquitin conjugating enzyme hybrid localization domain protein [Leptospira licerasiae str. MMD4847]
MRTMNFLKILFPSPFKIHRLVEVLSIILFLVFSGLCLYEFGKLSQSILHDAPWIFLSKLVVLLFLAYITADFLSGFVHFLGDSFGNEFTPYIGPAFIFPFRDHHVDPKGITRHDFVETNGNNCLVSFPILLYCFFAPLESGNFPWGRTFWILVLIGIFFTNQIHKWAHQDEPNKLIKYMQKKRWILSPEHHKIHHTAPYDTYFCITTGWWNPLLHKIRFFPTVKKSVNSFLNLFRFD